MRAGLCHPARHQHRLLFSFQDIVLLRTAHGLLRSRLPLRRVRAALKRLALQLPAERPLSGVRIYADGRDIVVRDGRATWRPETGQMVLSFAVDDLARAAQRVTSVCSRRRATPTVAATGPPPDSDMEDAGDWFDRALDLEQKGDLQAAHEAYLAALRLDPEFADAYVNLGRLAHQQGQSAEAARLYQRAIASDPNDPIAHYNLAIALEDQADLQAAVAHYSSALEIDPSFADAHFNLSRILDRLGRRVEALRHLLTYKKLTRKLS